MQLARLKVEQIKEKSNDLKLWDFTYFLAGHSPLCTHDTDIPKITTTERWAERSSVFKEELKNKRGGGMWEEMFKHL